MAKIRIYIDDQELELDAETTLSQNYSVEEVTDIDSSSDAVTKTISVPESKRNNTIFKFAGDPNVVDPATLKLYNQSNHIGIIKEEGTRTMKGLVKLLKFAGPIGNRRYEFMIIGNSKIWIEYMKEHQVDELTISALFDHTYDKPDIVAAEQGTKPYVYPLLNVGDSIGKIQPVARPMVPEDFDPFLFLRPIFLGCFQAAGYQVISEFIDSFFFSRLIFSARIPLKLPSTIEAAQFKVGLFQGVELWSIVSNIANSDAALVPFDLEEGNNIQGTETDCQDINGLFDPQTHYFQGDPGCSVRFCVKLTIQKFYELSADQNGILSELSFFPNVIMVQLVTYRSTPNQYNLWYDVLQETPWYYGPDTPQNYGTARDFEYKFQAFVPDPNQKYGIAFKLIPGPDSLNPGILWWLNDFQWSHPTLMMDGCRFWTEASERLTRGDRVSVSELLPQWDQIDLIKAVRHLFNLKFLTNIETRTVYIEPRDDFYRRDKIVDLISRLDSSREIEITDLGDDIEKRVTFKYKDDAADIFVHDMRQVSGQELAAYTATNESVHAQGERAVENPIFAPTLMDKAPEIGLTNTRIPKIQDAPGTDQRRIWDYAPRILFFAGIKQCNGTDAWIFDGEYRNTFPFASSADIENPNDNSLYFGDLRTLTFGTLRGLFQKYYFNTIKTINEARRILAHFNLTPDTVAGLINPDEAYKDYRAIWMIKLGGETIPCRLEKVTDYDGTNPTPVTLVKDVDRLMIWAQAEIQSMIPSNGATNVAMNTPIQLTTSGHLVKGVGFITIYNTSGSIFEKILVSSTQIQLQHLSSPDQTVITIDITDYLHPSQTYYVMIDGGAFITSQGVAFEGIQSSSRWRWQMEAKTLTTVDIYPWYQQYGSMTLYANGTIRSSNQAPSNWNHTRDFLAGSQVQVPLTGTSRIYSRKLGQNYEIQRAGMYFKTLYIPPTACILDAKLSLFAIKPIDIGLLNAKLSVHEGQMPTSSLSTTDWNKYGAKWGQSEQDPIENQQLVIPFNMTGRAGIQKAGYTKLMIRESEMDVANVPPQNGPPESNSIRIIETYLNGAPAGRAPFLRLTYYT